MWGQEWLGTASVLEEVDVAYLIWNIKKIATWVAEMPDRCVVRFDFRDQVEEERFHWMIYEQNEIDLCNFDPGLEINVWVECELRAMVEVWMGWSPLEDVLSSHRLRIDGPPALVDDPMRWMGRSLLANVAKRPEVERVE